MIKLDHEAVVDLVELAYDDWSDPTWRPRLVERRRGVLPTTCTAGFYEFQTENVEGGLSMRMKGTLSVAGEEQRAGAMDALMGQPPPLIETFFMRSHANTASEQSGAGAEMAEWPAWRAMWNRPVSDSLGLVSRSLSGEGLLLYAGLTATTRLNAREHALLTKVTVHLGAGQRLSRGERLRALDDAEAILTPNGKVVHALEEARKKLASLDDGRRRRDEARRTKDNAEKALDIWQGLVAGRWSLVDHFDTDGKRFLLAMKNAPKVDKRDVLTARERRACALVAMGHRDKEIAYMLGLSLASVTASLHRARGKLGVTSRSALARAWRDGAKRNELAPTR